jgi:hypothetical protein
VHDSAAIIQVIADTSVQRLFSQLMTDVRGLHSQIRISESEMDVRVEFNGCFLCRMVPYRELVHIQLGEPVTWEVRVRDATGFLSVTDRIAREFIRSFGQARAGMTESHKNL